MDGAPIPVIDVGPAVDGSDPAAVAHALGEAIRTVGFLQIVGHGIDPQRFHSLHDESAALWALPPDVLERWRSPIGHPFRGVYHELDDAGRYRRQALQNNRIWSAEEALALGVSEAHAGFFGGNVMPPMPALAAAYDAVFVETRALGHTLVGLFALELGLGIDGFADAFAVDASYLASLNYPNLPGSSGGDIRNGEHSDSGALAMLHQRGDYEGLFVRLRTGERVAMPIIDEALVVNVGDLMARWTNDQWLATPHWVAGGGDGRARSTVVTHFLPGVDTVIAPLPQCCAEGAAAYEPVSMFDWNDRYFAKRNRVLRLETAVA